MTCSERPDDVVMKPCNVGLEVVALSGGQSHPEYFLLSTPAFRRRVRSVRSCLLTVDLQGEGVEQSTFRSLSRVYSLPAHRRNRFGLFRTFFLCWRRWRRDHIFYAKQGVLNLLMGDVTRMDSWVYPTFPPGRTFPKDHSLP